MDMPTEPTEPSQPSEPTPPNALLTRSQQYYKKNRERMMVQARARYWARQGLTPPPIVGQRRPEPDGVIPGVTKFCAKCGQIKSVNDFHKSKSRGTQGYCKKCKTHYWSGYIAPTPQAPTDNTPDWYDTIRLNILKGISTNTLAPELQDKFWDEFNRRMRLRAEELRLYNVDGGEEAGEAGEAAEDSSIL